MAPKKAAKRNNEEEVIDKVAAEQQAQQKECERLKELALENGILTDEIGRVTTQLPLSKTLVKANGKDIVKKSSIRKNRYLVIVNALLAPAAAGRMGTLAQLDTRNPLMYLDFPEGRIKLFGTLVFPRVKYMALRVGGSASVMAEDVFENMLVFSDACWVGTLEENPEEKRLPMPPHLQHPEHAKPAAIDAADTARLVHTHFDYAYGAGPKPGEPGGPAKISHAAAAGAGVSSGAAAGVGVGGVVAAVGLLSQEPINEHVDTPAPPSSQRPQRTAARPQYCDLVDSDEDMEEEHGNDMDSGDHNDDGDVDEEHTVSRKRPRVTTAACGAAGRRTAGRAGTDTKGVTDAVTEGVVLPSRAVGVRAAAAVARRNLLKGAEEEEEEEEGDGGDSDEDGLCRRAKKRCTPTAMGTVLVTPRRQQTAPSGHKAAGPAAARISGTGTSGKAPAPVITIDNSDNEDDEDSGGAAQGMSGWQRPASTQKMIQADGGEKRPARAGSSGRRGPATPVVVVDDDDDDDEEEEREEGTSEEEEHTPAAESSSSDDRDSSDVGEDNDEQDDADAAPRTRRTAAPTSRRASGAAAANDDDSDVFLISDNDEKNEQGRGRSGSRGRGRGRGEKPVVAAAKGAGRGGRKAGAGGVGRSETKKRRRVIDSDDEEEESMDDDDDDDDDAGDEDWTE